MDVEKFKGKIIKEITLYERSRNREVGGWGGEVTEKGLNIILGDTHEIQFLRIKTGHSSLVISNHNVHNGCYAGFSLHIRGGEE